MPESGHCASAATSASCARSSARPTSRTIRTSAAISRVDSRRQTASMAALLSPAKAVPVGHDHRSEHPGRSTSKAWSPRRSAQAGGVSPSPVNDWPDLAAALPSGPVVQVDLQQPPAQLDRLLLGPHLDHRIAADQFLGLGERAVQAVMVPFASDTIAPCSLDPSPPCSTSVPFTAAFLRVPPIASYSAGGAGPARHGLVGLDQAHESHGGSFSVRPAPVAVLTLTSTGVPRSRHRPAISCEQCWSARNPAGRNWTSCHQSDH